MSETSPAVRRILDVMPCIRQLCGEEAALAVSDRETYLFHEDGKTLKMSIRPGDPIVKGGVADHVVQTGETIVKRVPREVMGVPYIGRAVPIVENGRVEGSVVSSLPVDVEDRLNQMARRLDAAVEAVAAGSTGFASSAGELSAASAELAGNARRITDEINDMDTVISLIMEIASQTHLLGLNAAIEAARAGDLGHGFNVVAEEIRKLAARVQSSAKEVTAKIERIKNNINTLNEYIQRVSSVSQEQAATSEEISSSIDDLEPIAKDLTSISEKLLG